MNMNKMKINNIINESCNPNPPEEILNCCTTNYFYVKQMFAICLFYKLSINH